MYPYKKTTMRIQGQRDLRVITKPEIGVMLLQAKKCPVLPANHQKLERSEKRFPYSFQTKYSPAKTLIFVLIN